MRVGGTPCACRHVRGCKRAWHWLPTRSWRCPGWLDVWRGTHARRPAVGTAVSAPRHKELLQPNSCAAGKLQVVAVHGVTLQPRLGNVTARRTQASANVTGAGATAAAAALDSGVHEHQMHVQLKDGSMRRIVLPSNQDEVGMWPAAGPGRRAACMQKISAAAARMLAAVLQQLHA